MPATSGCANVRWVSNGGFMRMPQAVLGVAVALLALTAPVRPQDAGPDAGRAVRLTLRTGGKVPGRFDRWSRGTVWVDRGDGPIALPRPEYVRR